MALITSFPGNALVAPPDQTFDITTIVAKRVGPYLNYYSFCTDGTMFVLHSTAIPGPDGTPVATITGWDHFSGADLLQSAALSLPLQPLLDNMYSRNPSSTRAVNWLFGQDDTWTGSKTRDVMHGLAGDDSLSGGAGRDVLRGDAGNDWLDGGTGIDRLTGGTGADHFVFHNPTEGGDRITDFHAGEDRIALDAATFGHTIETGTATTDAATILISGNSLLWDADGTGSTAAVLIATLDGAPALTATDIDLI